MTMFLSRMTREQKAEAMATLTQERLEQIIKRFSGGGNVSHTKNVREALEAADADFTVEKFPAQAAVPGPDGKAQLLTIPGKAAICGVHPDGRVVPFGTVGEKYRPIQNLEAFAAAEVLAEQGAFQPMSIRTRNGGAYTELQGLVGFSTLGNLPTTDEPDVLAHLMRFEANHDGTRSTMAALYSVRLVCLNGMTTLEQAAREQVKHTARADKRMEEATALLLGVQEAALKETALYQELAKRPFGKKAFSSFALALLDEMRGALDEESREAAKARREQEVQELLGYFNEPAMGTFGKTAMDGYNAITRWLSPRLEQFQDAAAHARALASGVEGHGSRVRSAAQRLLLTRAR